MRLVIVNVERDGHVVRITMAGISADLVIHAVDMRSKRSKAQSKRLLA